MITPFVVIICGYLGQPLKKSLRVVYEKEGILNTLHKPTRPPLDHERSNTRFDHISWRWAAAPAKVAYFCAAFGRFLFRH